MLDRSHRPVLLLLITAALAATGLRDWQTWRGSGPWLQDLPKVPPGFQLRVLEARRLPVAPANFQLAALVQRHAPADVLHNRVLQIVPNGVVAIGRTASGQQALQTCLMVTGRSAVTYVQMRAEVLNTAPAGRPEQLRRAAAALLFGVPWRQRTCHLVLLSTTAAHSQAANQQLLTTWHQLRPLLVSSFDVPPGTALDARLLAPLRP